MKRFLSSFTWMALFVLGAHSALAALPPYYYDCTLNDTCALYVDDSYQGVGSGSKSAPYPNITAAMNSVQGLEDYTRIYIAGGTYDNETFPWNLGTAVGDDIRIYGGYDSTFTTLDPEQNPVNINANGADEVLKIDGLEAIVSGLTIYGTDAPDNFSVMSINNTGATSHQITVRDNVFHDNDGNDNILRVNVSGSNTGLVENNRFYNNESSSTGTTLAVLGEVETRNNIIYANKMNSGVTCGLDSLMYNNYILGNTAQNIVSTGLGCSFYNNTIVDNDVLGPGADSSLVYMIANGNEIYNNLFAYNGGVGTVYRRAGNDTTSILNYNVLFDNSQDPTTPEGNNVDCDPLLGNKDSINPEDLQLGAGSECIDTGTNVSEVTVDYFGTARPADGDGVSGANNDPGAYEAPDLQIDAPVISNLEISPDPFSPNDDNIDESTNISFEISETATVSVAVIINNSKYPLIDNEIKSAGQVSVNWDGTYMDNNNNIVDADDGTYDLEIGASNAGGSDDEMPTVTIDRTLEEEQPEEEEEEQCAGYSDVPASHPSCDAIEYVQSIGAMTGNPDGTFAPTELLQRDQVAKISLETFGLFDDTADYCDGTDPFPDVPPAQWSYQYICQGVEIDMITGYEAGADAGFYRPARQVNRVEFLALILRNLSDTMPADSSTSYSDVEPNQWFSGYARYSLDNDLFEGPNLFPTQGTQRVEVADVLYQLHNLGKI